jgi:glycosyltransferase involved in cell wall biosynthesis
MDFTVCMSVYQNDKMQFLKIALDSVLEQTVKPKEIVLIIDGPIPENIRELIQEYKNEYHDIISVVYLPVNKGLGNALKIAVDTASCELIARMDSDDIALSDRFEKQLKCFEENPQLSIVGGSISEFIGNPDNIVARRICPLEDKEIKQYMKSRCGFNHMTVMFKKSDVLKAGNYKDCFWNEDYFLWLRMMLENSSFMNLKDVLVNVRVGKDMYSRRGGFKYFKSEFLLQLYMFENNIIGVSRFLLNIIARFVVQILVPNNFRGFIFRFFLRESVPMFIL